MSNDYYVYVHLRGDSGEPFYYGKGKDKRAWKPKRNVWHDRIVEKCGMEVVILFSGLTNDQANVEEKRLIAEGIARGEILTNTTPGGDGVGSEIARAAGNKTVELKLGLFGRTAEKVKQDAAKAGRVSALKNMEMKTGIFAITEEEKRKTGLRCKAEGLGIHAPEVYKLAGKRCKERKIGIFTLTKDQLREQGLALSSLRVECSCGMVSNPGAIARHKKVTGHG